VEMGAVRREGELWFLSGVWLRGEGRWRGWEREGLTRGKGKVRGGVWSAVVVKENQKPGGAGDFFFGRDGEWAAALVREKKGF